jgi:PAS domain S-box-containing protein
MPLDPKDIAQLRLASIVASADDAIISKDLDGTITSWNRAAERIFGYTESEAIGQSIHLIVPPELHDDEENVLRQVRRGHGVDHYETVRLRKDGTRVDVSLTISPIISANGEVIGVSKIARDVTDRRRLESVGQHFAAIVASSEDAIASKDLNGIVTSWNGAAERMFGYSASEMVGKSIRKIIPDDRQREEDTVLSRIRRGERVEHFETVRQRKDGSLVSVSLTVSPIRGPDGTILGASKIARDISDRERAERERQRLLAVAQEASRLKDEFLATLSHELRTPLNAIVGYVRMMQSDLLTGEKRKRAMDTVARNVTSLAQIVEDVLDVSRIISGKLRLDIQRVDLAPIVQSALETVRPAADVKGVHLVTIVDPRTPAVSGDPERLQQILWNVLSNAVKFTGRGGKVQVRLEQVNSHIEITVSDTGAGISPEFLPHVFDRFRQADGGMDRASGGLGLGLAITRHLVELQGGRIFASSEGIGNGSTFRIELPCRIADAAAAVETREHPRSPTDEHHIAVPQLNGTRILAVDDDRDALALIQEILEATGATVTTADTGGDALAALERTIPDVLLADLGMSPMTGFELIERVRQSDNPRIRAVPAAALTAYARSEDRTKALLSGFQLHLAKPVDPGELMAAMAALARRDRTPR